MRPLWDRANTEHIRKHDVTKAEAEFVLNHAAPPFPDELGEGKYVVRGQTAAGRYLQVIFVYKSPGELDYLSLTLEELIAFEDDAPMAYVVHARDLTEREKRRLSKRR